jgi:hypothetical protein
LHRSFATLRMTMTGSSVELRSAPDEAFGAT